MMVIKEAAIVRCRVCLLIILAIVFCGSVSARPLAFSSSASDGSSGFVRTSAQKGVATSTDLLVIAMPVATLAGVIIEGDWQGLKQGALSAVTAAGATLILKYAVKEERPDHSNMHSFPSGHTAVAFTNATFLQRRYGWKFGVPAYAVAAYVGWGECSPRNITGGMCLRAPRLEPVPLLYIHALLPKNTIFRLCRRPGRKEFLFPWQ